MFDRRQFLIRSGALGAAALAPPLWARGLPAVPEPDFERMVEVAGGRVYVRVNGKLGTGRPPLIVTHGGPGGTGIAYFNLIALADDRPLILYDQLDSGRSDHPNDPANWTVPRFVDEVDSIRSALGVKRWHVMGHSWGGTIALEYGARRNPSLAGLVLASPLVSTKSWISDADVLRRELPADVQQVLKACDPPAPITPACATATDEFYARFLVRKPRLPAVAEYRKRHPETNSNETIYNAMWGSSEFVATGTLRDYDGEPLLDRLDGPRTLFVCGQYDEARPDTVEKFARRANADFAVLPGSGHALSSDAPDELVGLLRPWLRHRDS